MCVWCARVSVARVSDTLSTRVLVSEASGVSRDSQAKSKFCDDIDVYVYVKIKKNAIHIYSCLYLYKIYIPI